MRLRVPHPFVLLGAAVAIAAALTWIVPAGEFERREDAATGRQVVVAGTYHRVDPAPVTPFGALVAVPKGLIDAASVIFLVFLVGGAFAVVDQTGAMRRAVDALARRLKSRRVLVIPLIAMLFAAGGALANMQEEIIAMIPALLVLSSRFGWGAVTVVAMSAGAAIVGSAFSPINPFQVGIAQKLAGLPLLSGAGFRLVVFAAALALWIWFTMRRATRDERVVTTAAAAPVADALVGERTASPPDNVPPATRDAPPATGDSIPMGLSARDGVILALVGITYVVFVIGILRWHWGFEEMSAAFFAMGILAGVVGGLRLSGTADAFVEGFKAMAFAAMLIGFARAITVVLEQGHVIDTIVNGMFTPLANLPVTVSALAMLGVHTGVHVPVPSVSGHAVLTMPLLVPLSDLLGLSRQVTVLAYQYGAGLCDLLTPTNGTLMAIIAAAGARYDEWLRFAVKAWATLLTVGAVAIMIAIAIRLT